MMALLTNFKKVQLALSARRSYSLVDKPSMKQYFHFSSVSTCSGAYYARLLNILE
jgi:hypothetical protein